ncbi:UPF0246 protein [Alphaproteobacteria bacterium]|nr:UPF0246 protein [Alphaproteobacteria bacterium]
MIILLSPAKSLDYKTNFDLKIHSQPEFIKEAEILAKELKKLDSKNLENLMDISPNLAQLNFQRFKDFAVNPQRQALLAYDGDVYSKITKNKFTEKNFKYAQEHIRIISGLYGILRPLDLIKPYRLEMATDFSKVDFFKKNLYEFWSEKINDYLSKDKSKDLVNLASQEYSAVIDFKKIPQKVYNIIFKEKKNGVFKIIGINAKKARGLMANYAILNNITDPIDLKKFKDEDYSFNQQLSDPTNWIFSR